MPQNAQIIRAYFAPIYAKESYLGKTHTEPDLETLEKREAAT